MISSVSNVINPFTTINPLITNTNILNPEILSDSRFSPYIQNNPKDGVYPDFSKNLHELWHSSFSLFNTSSSLYPNESQDVFNRNDSFLDMSLYGNSSNETFSGANPQIPYYIRVTSMVFCIIIMCLGVVGNVMVPIVIFKTKDMRNSTNIFLVNLSIADLMVLLVCTPTVLVEVNTRPETWVLGKEMCLAVPFVELTVAHASVLTILAISFERYYAICEPLRAGYVCTKTRATLICALAWFVAAVFTSPILAVASYQLEDYFDGSIVPVCLTLADTFWPAVFFILTITIFFIIPLAILIILYTVIAMNLMENPAIIAHHSKNNPMSGGSVLRYRKQVVLMLGTVVLSFFVCLLPFRALTLWIIIVPAETIMSLGIEGYYILLYFCRIMFYLNSAVNPILYNLMSTKFRDGFVKLLKINKLINCRMRFKESIHRKDTFNTTTSTNLSSSQNTSDSFWRRYSNRNSSQKNSVIHNGSVNKDQRDVDVEVHIQQIKIGEIVSVENTRRNSMNKVAELAAVRNDIGSEYCIEQHIVKHNSINEKFKEIDLNIDESSSTEIIKETSSDSKGVNTCALVSGNDLENKSRKQHTPLITAKDSIVLKKKRFPKESFV